jgi:hypothetical protein
MYHKRICKEVLAAQVVMEQPPVIDAQMVVEEPYVMEVPPLLKPFFFIHLATKLILAAGL